jgi:hypothetical protein
VPAFGGARQAPSTAASVVHEGIAPEATRAVSTASNALEEAPEADSGQGGSSDADEGKGRDDKGRFLPKDGKPEKAKAQPAKKAEAVATPVKAEKKAEPKKPAAAAVAKPEPVVEEAEEAEAEPEAPADPKEAIRALAKEHGLQVLLGDDELPREEFEKLVKKQGYAIDRAGRVTWQERNKFREQKAEESQRLEQRAAELQANLDARIEKLTGENSRATKLEKAIESGDFDGIASAIGRKNWEALQKEAVDQLSDPHYRQLMELQKREDERERQAEEAKRQAQQRQEQEKELRAEQEGKTWLRDYMASSKNPLVAAMHDDPFFINTIFHHQKESWDGENLASPEEIVRRTPAIRQHLEQMYKRLAPLFTSASAPAKPAAAEEPEEPVKSTVVASKKPMPREVSTKGSVGASGKLLQGVDPMSDEWFHRASERARLKAAEEAKRG